jgi:hypothetical protein
MNFAVRNVSRSRAKENFKLSLEIKRWRGFFVLVRKLNAIKSIVRVLLQE